MFHGSRLGGVFLATTFAASLSGCAGVAPSALTTPERLSCINITEPLELTDKYGLLDIAWEVRLTPGTYISEKADEQGTYYRAPPGGVYVGKPEMKDKPSGPGTHMRYDGGIFVPKTDAVKPRVYSYISLESKEERTQPKGVTCGQVVYEKDPVTGTVNLTSAAVGGGAGGIVGRAMAPKSGISYGQAAAGGAIGMLIVGSFMNAEVGRITTAIDLKNEEFLGKLRRLGNEAVPLQKNNPGQL